MTVLSGNHADGLQIQYRTPKAMSDFLSRLMRMEGVANQQTAETMPQGPLIRLGRTETPPGKQKQKWGMIWMMGRAGRTGMATHFLGPITGVQRLLAA